MDSSVWPSIGRCSDRSNDVPSSAGGWSDSESTRGVAIAVTPSSQTVNKTLSLLDLFITGTPEQSASEIARGARLPLSTAFRLLSTLVRLRYLDYNEQSRKYRLGLKLLELGYIVSRQLDLPRAAAPYLHAIANESMETSHLSMRDGDEGVLVAKVETSHSVRLHTPLGRRVPLHAGASMKVMLAFLTDQEIDRYLTRSSLLQLTPNTICDPDTLWTDIRKIRKQGYAVTYSEQTQGAAGVAGPVRDYSGEVVAGLTISGPEQRFTPKIVDALSKIVVRAACKLSLDLGCPAEMMQPMLRKSATRVRKHIASGRK